MMPIETKDQYFDELVKVCTDLKNANSIDMDALTTESGRMAEILNSIFDNTTCVNAIFTNNTDNFIFGVMINPSILDADLIKIIMTEEPVKFDRYFIEIDSKAIEVLDPVELAAYIVEDVATMIDENCIEKVRNFFNIVLAGNDEVIEIKNSINYSQILEFGVKDIIRKITSLLYKDPAAVGVSEYAQAFEISDIAKDVAGKIKPYMFGEEEVGSGNPKLGIIQWCLMVYKNVDMYCKMAEDTLKTSAAATGSVLEKREIEQTIKCIRRATTEVLAEAAILEQVVSEFSLFKGLRQRGLQQLENDMYEYKVRLKNCEDLEEAMYILRQVNTRIGILQDYLATTEVSEAEADRWRSLINDYMQIRVDLSKKKIFNKKQYGLFFDYDRLDELDKPRE